MAKKFTKNDFQTIAEYVIDEYSRRKKDRKDLEKEWHEIDRQLRMEPDIAYKRTPDGKQVESMAWMPETELPLQSQTLEILTADARRLMSPDDGPWFRAHTLTSDEYLDRVSMSSLIAGDENDLPSNITQDNADKLVSGLLNHCHRQYDFWGNIDLINAEAFKYSMGVGRARVVTKEVFLDTARGLVKQKQKIPVLFPLSVKNTYLDDREFALMNEGYHLSPAHITYKVQSVKDLQIAASKGNSNPESENGGWMGKAVADLEGDQNGNIEIVEYEGDLVVPRKTTDSIYLPNVCVSVVVGTKGKDTEKRVVRLRLKNPTSIIQFPYHKEHVASAYGTSPLMKGWPIQKAAVDALNRVLMAGALSTQPPISYDNDDPHFAQDGGPRVYPGAQWSTISQINVHDNIGNPAALFNIYVGLLQQYADVTGVNAPRLGAQTVSHTTAFAKEAELSRGTIRTVDYVRSTLNGPMAQWLDIEYKMARENVKNTTYYIDEYNGFVTVDKSDLPDEAIFKAYGSGGPSEEQAKRQMRMQAVQMVLSVEQLAAQFKQLGVESIMDFNAMARQILAEGGWTDVEAITRAVDTVAGVAGGPPMAGYTGTGQVAPATALQMLQGQGAI